MPHPPTRHTTRAQVNLNLSEMLLLDYTSALSMNVAGIFKVSLKP